MEKKDTIQVLVLEPKRQPPTGRQAFPEAENVMERVVDVPVAAVKEGVRKATEQVAEIVRDMPVTEELRLDEVAIQLMVSANGNVQWVLGLGVEVSSTMTLTFKIADSAEGGAS